MKALLLLAGIALGACAMSDPDLSARSGAPAYRPTGAAPPTVGATSSDLTGRVWFWQRTELDGRTSVAAAPERYTLEFQGGGRVLVRADCNRGSASYEVNAASMKLGPVALTRIGCPAGTQDTEFVQPLARATGYTINGNELVIALGPAGSMRFKATL